MDFHLEHCQSIHPGNEAGQSSLSSTTYTDQQQVALRLAEDTVNAEHVVEDFIEQDQRHIELFLVEYLQT